MQIDIASKEQSAAKFATGRIVATPSALSEIPNEEIIEALSRHILGDWGLLDKEDWSANERAIRGSGRLFSAYNSKRNIRFWIITEADRSATTILLPEDY